MGCAWPDPDPEHRSIAEFCENGAKAVAEEAHHRPCSTGVLRRAHPSRSSRRTATTGSASRGGSPSRWCCARDAHALRADLVGRRVRPDRRDPARPRRARTRRSSTPAGKTSNEAAFAYQLFARAFGTNNLPDCSNMCHESTSVALAETIGIGKGSVSLEDVHDGRAHRHRRPEPRHQPPADAQRARDRQGARRQDPRGQPAARGRPDAVRQPADGQGPRPASAPSSPTCTCRSGSTATSRCSRRSAPCSSRRRGGRTTARSSTSTSSTAAHDRASRRGPTHMRDARLGRRARRRHRAGPRPDRARRPTCSRASDAHRALLGDGDHPAPQRGRDDQGDRQRRARCRATSASPAPDCARCAGTPTSRATARWASGRRCPTTSSTRCATSSASSRPASTASTPSTRSARCATARPRSSSGWAATSSSAAPDTVVDRGGDARAELTVKVSTKLNRSHVALRAHRADPARARPQRAGPHRRRRPAASPSRTRCRRCTPPEGRSSPPSPHLRSEVDIVCGMAEATLGAAGAVPWADYRSDYTKIRDAIAHVVPGLRGVRREGRPARWLRAAAPAARLPHVPDQGRAGRSSR